MPTQLIKTTPYLSGQHRIDVVLKQTAGRTTNESVHIVPLSDKVRFNENDKRPTFNYSHSENIKYLYNQTHETFFKTLKERNDSIVYSNKPIDTYDHTYQSGLKRISNDRYGRQFSFLCPVWYDGEWLNSAEKEYGFRFTVKTLPDSNNVQYVVNSKIVKFDDIFKSYLEKYLSDNHNELININLDRNQASVKGLEVSSGTTITKDVSYFITNLMIRERPLMEFDSMICSTLQNNRIIAKQLINFNFIFNYEDIVSTYAVAAMKGKKWNVCVEAGRINIMNNVETFYPFEVKDIYSNYNYIPTYEVSVTGGDYSTNTNNVLDYLNDNECVDFIYENKTVQPLCHWALSEKPDYLYNFYNGFSPYYNGEQMNGQYYGTPSATVENYSVAANNLNWCKLFYNKNSITQIDFDKCTVFPNSILTDSEDNGYWIQWLKYDRNKINEIISATQLPSGLSYKLCINIVNGNTLPIGGYSLKYEMNGNICNFFVSGGNDVCLNILSQYLSKFTIKNIKDRFELGTTTPTTQQKVVDFLNYVARVIGTVIAPTKVIFNKGVYPERVKSLSVNTTEVSYKKANYNSNVSLYRYSGHITPMFINIENISLSNEHWIIKQFADGDLNNANIKEYNKWLSSKTAAVFPSASYFALEKIEANLYEIPSYFADKQIESCWFNASTAYKLPSEINIVVQSQSISEGIVESKLKEYFDNELYFEYDTSSPYSEQEQFERFMWPIYKYDFDFDYASIDDINNKNYYIKYKLK